MNVIFTMPKYIHIFYIYKHIRMPHLFPIQFLHGPNFVDQNCSQIPIIPYLDIDQTYLKTNTRTRLIYLRNLYFYLSLFKRPINDDFSWNTSSWCRSHNLKRHTLLIKRLNKCFFVL